MSHFTVLVITPHTSECPQETFEDEVEKMLAPYSESLKVDEYDKPCYCIGDTARSEVRGLSDNRFGSWEDLRTKFHSEVFKPSKPWYDMTDVEALTYNDDRDKAWGEFTKEKKQFEHDAFEHHPLKDKTESDCVDCNGTGFYKSNRNPKSKWDWYEIGGRWSGELHENGLNIFKAKELKSGTFVVVTPDGEWHEKGKMGWFAIVTNEDGEWDNRCMELVAQYGDNYAVLVDCHI